MNITIVTVEGVVAVDGVVVDDNVIDSDTVTEFPQSTACLTLRYVQVSM